MTITSTTLFYTTLKYNPQSLSQISIGNAVVLVFTFISISSSWLIGIILFKKQSSFLGAFNTLANIDQMFTRLKLYFTYKYYVWITVSTFVFCILCLFIPLVYVVFIREKFSIFEFNIELSNIGGFCLRQIPSFFQFSFMVFIAVRINCLNKILESWNFIKLQKEIVQSQATIIAYIHEKLCRITGYMNDAFGFMFAVNLAQTSLAMLFVVLTVFNFEIDLSLTKVYWWSFCNVAPTWVILCFAHYQKTEVNKNIRFALVESRR